MVMLRYSVSRVNQGKNRFYTLTMPSRILAGTCFVSRRDEDPKVGFQRMLDRTRAQDIATYIDNGGVIPSSIVLSAQPDSQANIIGQGKTLQFKSHPKSFLVLDGQHRVYGFQLAKTEVSQLEVAKAHRSPRQEMRQHAHADREKKPLSNRPEYRAR